MNKRRFLRTSAFACAVCLAGAGHAQDFPPRKPVTLVVGFAPGGAADAAARLIAKKLGDDLGQTVIVDNRAGAGGNIAQQYVANGPADGSMLLFGSIGTFFALVFLFVRILPAITIFEVEELAEEKGRAS